MKKNHISQFFKNKLIQKTFFKTFILGKHLLTKDEKIKKYYFSSYQTHPKPFYEVAERFKVHNSKKHLK